jgi:lipoate-protein ligase A
VQKEVEVSACRERGIPILRRTSGGAAIVAGPGCLMYAVVLSYRLRPELKDIGRAHRFVLGRLADVLQLLLGESTSVHCDGTSDLVFAPSGTLVGGSPTLLKFSGNSMRAKRTHLLYHGTLLYGFDLSLVDSCLRMPPRQPCYRAGRSHSEFVTNLPVARQALVAAIEAAWPTSGEIGDWPRERVASLVVKQFGQDWWIHEFQ